VSAYTAEPALARGWPRRRLLLALLIVSAALNLFFIVGAVWTRMHPPDGLAGREQRYRQMAAQLDLAPDQRQGFERYVAAMNARDEKMRQQVAPLIGSAWQEIAKSQPNTGQIMQRFDEASARWREFQREATTQTLDFLSILSPSQRDKFIALVRERRAPWLRPHGQAR
jgi:Spy/CpxP family protein refolding chaperone